MKSQSFISSHFLITLSFFFFRVISYSNLNMLYLDIRLRNTYHVLCECFLHWDWTVLYRHEKMDNAKKKHNQIKYMYKQIINKILWNHAVPSSFQCRSICSIGLCLYEYNFITLLLEKHSSLKCYVHLSIFNIMII